MQLTIIGIFLKCSILLLAKLQGASTIDCYNCTDAHYDCTSGSCSGTWCLAQYIHNPGSDTYATKKSCISPSLARTLNLHEEGCGVVPLDYSPFIFGNAGPTTVSLTNSNSNGNNGAGSCSNNGDPHKHFIKCMGCACQSSYCNAAGFLSRYPVFQDADVRPPIKAPAAKPPAGSSGSTTATSPQQKFLSCYMCNALKDDCRNGLCRGPQCTVDVTFINGTISDITKGCSAAPPKLSTAAQIVCTPSTHLSPEKGMEIFLNCGCITGDYCNVAETFANALQPQRPLAPVRLPPLRRSTLRPLSRSTTPGQLPFRSQRPGVLGPRQPQSRMSWTTLQSSTAESTTAMPTSISSSLLPESTTETSSTQETTSSMDDETESTAEPESTTEPSETFSMPTEQTTAEEETSPTSEGDGSSFPTGPDSSSVSTDQMTSPTPASSTLGIPPSSTHLASSTLSPITTSVSPTSTAQHSSTRLPTTTTPTTTSASTHLTSPLTSRPRTTPTPNPNMNAPVRFHEPPRNTTPDMVDLEPFVVLESEDYDEETETSHSSTTPAITTAQHSTTAAVSLTSSHVITTATPGVTTSHPSNISPVETIASTQPSTTEIHLTSTVQAATSTIRITTSTPPTTSAFETSASTRITSTTIHATSGRITTPHASTNHAGQSSPMTTATTTILPEQAIQNPEPDADLADMHAHPTESSLAATHAPATTSAHYETSQITTNHQHPHATQTEPVQPTTPHATESTPIHASTVGVTTSMPKNEGSTSPSTTAITSHPSSRAETSISQTSLLLSTTHPSSTDSSQSTNHEHSQQTTHSPEDNTAEHTSSTHSTTPLTSILTSTIHTTATEHSASTHATTPLTTILTSTAHPPTTHHVSSSSVLPNVSTTGTKTETSTTPSFTALATSRIPPSTKPVTAKIVLFRSSTTRAPRLGTEDYDSPAFDQEQEINAPAVEIPQNDIEDDEEEVLDDFLLPNEPEPAPQPQTQPPPSRVSVHETFAPTTSVQQTIISTARTTTTPALVSSTGHSTHPTHQATASQRSPATMETTGSSVSSTVSVPTTTVNPVQETPAGTSTASSETSQHAQTSEQTSTTIPFTTQTTTMFPLTTSALRHSVSIHASTITNGINNIWNIAASMFASARMPTTTMPGPAESTIWPGQLDQNANVSSDYVDYNYEDYSSHENEAAFDENYSYPTDNQTVPANDGSASSTISSRDTSRAESRLEGQKQPALSHNHPSLNSNNSADDLVDESSTQSTTENEVSSTSEFNTTIIEETTFPFPDPTGEMTARRLTGQTTTLSASATTEMFQTETTPNSPENETSTMPQLNATDNLANPQNMSEVMEEDPDEQVSFLCNGLLPFLDLNCTSDILSQSRDPSELQAKRQVSKAKEKAVGGFGQARQMNSQGITANNNNKNNVLALSLLSWAICLECAEFL